MSDVGEVVADYETDFHAWAVGQATLLHERRLGALDVEHIAEELEALAGRERREMVSRLVVLLLHLLKWEFQPGLRGRSWQLTIVEHREELAELLDDNPSLRALRDNALARAYRRARRRAEQETGLPMSGFPESCAWTFEQVLDSAFWPGPA